MCVCVFRVGKTRGLGYFRVLHLVLLHPPLLACVITTAARDAGRRSFRDAGKAYLGVRTLSQRAWGEKKISTELPILWFSRNILIEWLPPI